MATNSQQCWVGSHRVYSVVAGLLTLLVPIGIPFTSLVGLYLYRRSVTRRLAPEAPHAALLSSHDSALAIQSRRSSFALEATLRRRNGPLQNALTDMLRPYDPECWYARDGPHPRDTYQVTFIPSSAVHVLSSSTGSRAVHSVRPRV